MPPTAGHVVDHACCASGSGDERIDQRRLADAGVADEDADATGQLVLQELEPYPVAGDGVTGRHEVADLEHRVMGQERRRVDEVGLGQHQERLHASVICRHQATVDHARSRLGVSQRRHDDELVGVGHDDSLDGVGVVRGSAQNRAAGLDAHDPGQRVGAARGVPDDRHLITDDDALASELAGLHGNDDVVTAPVHDQGVTAAVHAGHEPEDGILVSRAILGAGPGTPGVWPDPHVALVVRAGSRTHRPAIRLPPNEASPSAWTIPIQRAGKSGNVLSVVSTSSMTTPGTCKPSTAAAIAMR